VIEDAVIAWRDWDRAPGNVTAEAARERAVTALAESLGVSTSVLTAAIQQCRRDGMDAPRAIRRAVEVLS
jgi:hypothetical protein